MDFCNRRCLLWILGVGLLAGCGGDDDRPELGSVTGKVTMDGQPLPNVWVMFNPATGRTAMARTDENGEYEMMYLEDAAGANLGTHKVVIQTYAEDELYELQAEASEPIKEPIPEKYNTKTTLTAEVKPGENVIDFPLESK